jgi:hypothetical protein
MIPIYQKKRITGNIGRMRKVLHDVARTEKLHDHRITCKKAIKDLPVKFTFHEEINAIFNVFHWAKRNKRHDDYSSDFASII